MKSFKKRVLAAALSTAASGFTAGVSVAAVVPSDVVLDARQELVRNNGAEPQSLDPHKTQGVPEAAILRDLIEGLVITDPEGRMIPGVAESWSSDDFIHWTFKLRANAKWSNGDAVTAEDFVYAWQRLVDPKTGSPYASYLEYAHVNNAAAIVAGNAAPDTLGVQATDPHTFTVTLSQAVPYFPNMLFHSSVKPVHRATVEQFGDKWTAANTYVGNGAYKLKQWTVNERIVLTRNAAYWDDAKTVIDQVTYLTITSENTDVNRYRAGEIDVTYNLPSEIFPKLKKELPDQLMIEPLLCTLYYEMNVARPPFDDYRVRRALTLAIDRDIIVDKVRDQGEIVAFGLTPPYTDGAKMQAPAWYAWTQAERIAEARRLLAEAGYGKNKPLEFPVLYNTSESNKKIAVAVASMWRQHLGAKPQLENQEWKTFLETRDLGKHAVSRANWCADYNEPSTFLNILMSGASNNTAKYASAEFDALMAAALKATTEDARATLYRDAEALLDKDAVIVPLYHNVQSRLVKPYVGGLTGRNPMNSANTKDLYIKKR